MTYPNHRRLKGAPTLHWYLIGPHGREAHQADPTGPDYTHAQHNHDQQVLRNKPLAFLYNVDHTTEPPILKLTAPQTVMQALTTHFHPVAWPEYADVEAVELLAQIIPEMDVITPDLRVYETDRWFLSEASQRAAETLAHRIMRGGLVLPAAMPMTHLASPPPVPRSQGGMWQVAARFLKRLLGLTRR